MPDQCVTELKSMTQGITHNLFVIESPTIGQIIDIERFSTKQRLFRTTAYVLKFTTLLQKKATSAELTLDDVAEAEEIWIRMPSQFCGRIRNSLSGNYSFAFTRMNAKFGDVEGIGGTPRIMKHRSAKSLTTTYLCSFNTKPTF